MVSYQTVVEDNERVKIQCKRDIDEIISMKKGLKATYKKIGIMKYDTFRGMAGKLSFSLALLDGKVTEGQRIKTSGVYGLFHNASFPAQENMRIGFVFFVFRDLISKGIHIGKIGLQGCLRDDDRILFYKA